MRERLAELIRVLGISQKEFSEGVDLSPAYTSDVLNGRKQAFAQETLAKMVARYRVNLNWLLNNLGPMFVAPPLHAPDIKKQDGPLDKLGDRERKTVEDLIELLGSRDVIRVHRPEEPIEEDFRKIPIVARIAAGNPMESIEHAEDSVLVHKRQFAYKGKVFALRVRGESMIGAGIMDGDLAIMGWVEDPNQIIDGEIVAISLDGASTLKRFLRDNGRFILRAENPNFPDRDITGTDFPKIVGRYLGIIRLPKR